MKIWKTKMLAVSKAGHDKGRVYVVLQDDGQYCWLCDGKRKLLENPKKKKFMHLQVIKKVPAELVLPMEEITSDADIRRILKEYRRILENRQNVIPTDSEE